MSDKPETFTLPDVCPECGTEHPSIKSREVLNGYQPITISEDGGAAEWQAGDTDWESALTQDYIWDCCHEELPEADQRALDFLLHNERWDVTWTHHDYSEAQP